MAYKIGVEKLKNTTIYNYLVLIIFVDCLFFYIWLVALFGNKVKWRNHEFILDKEGQLNPLINQIQRQNLKLALGKKSAKT